ncbi:IQ and ubiquitin domain-containing protein [Paragonimus skrjabini miyazakii]|uniref:IQ and ubiquitin domain-containing protein n=1 Tax=Paragonimus skrjabini miyazakii TaxID=59628 RepID=A0A8S9YHS5_9TREM|nr:IQ and ubiquitin domain-containing protein [Paragonimus skrjabini miyazakii]
MDSSEQSNANQTDGTNEPAELSDLTTESAELVVDNHSNTEQTVSPEEEKDDSPLRTDSDPEKIQGNTEMESEKIEGMRESEETVTNPTGMTDGNNNYSSQTTSPTMQKSSGGGFNTNNHTFADAFETSEKDTISVHLLTECGTRLEFTSVPRKYYASDLAVLVVRDTGLKHDQFRILHNDEQVKPLKPLDELTNEHGLVQLNLEIKNLEKNSRKLCLGSRTITFKSGVTIDVICRKMFVADTPCSLEDVLVIHQEKDGTTENQYISINWLSPSYHKPFLGGYRHKLSNNQYHHAHAQTKPLPRKAPEVPVYSRDTQTYRMKHFGQTTVNHMSTQFPKPGFFVSSYNDQLKVPGPYETADEYLTRILRDVIIIQKYTRRWLAKRRVNKIRQLRDAYLEWERQHEGSLKNDKEAQRKHDFERRLHPKTQADFDRLFNALEQWKREEIAKINAQPLTSAERKAALALLLDEETELIAAIGRHQLCASQKGNEQTQINLLKKAAAPIRWTSSINGRQLEVETPQTLRAKELLDIFISLRLDCLTQEERLDVLLAAKRTAGQYQYKICKEIASLIDREAELIVRGVRAEQLKGLRQRINNQFIKFAEMPEVNPEIVKYITVPTGSREKVAESLKGDVHYCLSCDRYLRNTAFSLSARANRLAPCMSCLRLDNRARKRSDLDPYQRMLCELRKKEMELVEVAREQAKADAQEVELARLERSEPQQPETIVKTNGTDSDVLSSNPFPFLINKEDIRFLVDDVWERRSILSGWLDINDLVLARWRLNEPWSPWNMIVVTKEEAEAHEKLRKFPLELAYADAMLNTVNERLVMGRNAFPRLHKNGIKMAYEQVSAVQRMQEPEATQEWLQGKRQRLPPLAKHHTLLEASAERHRPVYQPPECMLPAIRGEKTLQEVGHPG